MTEPVPADPRVEAVAAALTEKQSWLEWRGVARVAVEAIDRLAAADAVLTPPADLVDQFDAAIAKARAAVVSPPDPAVKPSPRYGGVL